MNALGPGATIGIVGGGQLARMMALEARRMGYRVAVVAQDPEGPAAKLADHCIVGALDDDAAMDALAQCSDVVTLDSEHVSVSALDRIERLVPVRPSPSVLRTIQDRLTQRQFLAGCDAPQVRHEGVSSVEELESALEWIGRPAVLKTRRAGYDGRGQIRITEQTSAKEAFDALGGVPCVLEEFIAFDREVSVLLARSVDGEISFFPLAENEHRDHVLHLTLAPATGTEGLERRAQEVGVSIASALDHVGMLAVELFVTNDEILVNELAPRPHNSGHYTFGACATSQFEQHVRAVAGLPLGDTQLARPAVMVNLLGDLWTDEGPDWNQVLSAPDAHLHLYGKRDARPGRKMGHFLVLGNDASAARRRGEHLHELLSADPPLTASTPKEMTMKITIAPGDGIGPELMTAALSIFRAAGVPLEFESVVIGNQAVAGGDASGVSHAATESVKETGILFKGPVGEAAPFVDDTLRQLLGAFANKRVYRALRGVKARAGQAASELTIIRENIQDAGGHVEHMQTHDVAQCRRFITRPGSERLHRYAFEVAQRKGLTRVTCAHMASVMRMTDGLFRTVFYEVAQDYPSITADDCSADDLAMQLVLDPAPFQLIVAPSMAGDILGDVAAGLVGGLSYSPSANVGEEMSIFETAHDPQYALAGTDKANPSALILAGGMMLRHLGLVSQAQRIEAALEDTLAAMNRPPDLGQPVPEFRCSTFVAQMVSRLEGMPAAPDTTPGPLQPVSKREAPRMVVSKPKSSIETGLRGVDVFLESDLVPDALEAALAQLPGELTLTGISNRGPQLSSNGSVYTDGVNHYRARFEARGVTDQQAVLEHLATVAQGFKLCGAEWLKVIGGEQAYSSAGAAL